MVNKRSLFLFMLLVFSGFLHELYAQDTVPPSSIHVKKPGDLCTEMSGSSWEILTRVDFQRREKFTFQENHVLLVTNSIFSRNLNTWTCDTGVVRFSIGPDKYEAALYTHDTLSGTVIMYIPGGATQRVIADPQSLKHETMYFRAVRKK